jgi:hypothetical protein
MYPSSNVLPIGRACDWLQSVGAEYYTLRRRWRSVAGAAPARCSVNPVFVITWFGCQVEIEIPQ